ncbi:hypothetical protein CHS0354_041722 [Potamilus streckersoni]|uniref:Small ribosomal subunit protein uS7 domain-containing protein n=1 Tax=Potamilus streckersoni TaxID=2493646 RepID=A0AAE0T153_9BIVA|nr:hypothetical protein CHS0354_041722 [Potamilus streckersoni]
MALTGMKNLILRGVLCKRHAALMVIPVRGKIYSDDYISASNDMEDLSKPLTENDPRRYKKIMAAYTEHTTSVNFDPLVKYFTGVMLRKGRKHKARDVMDKTFENIKRIQLEKYHKTEGAEKATIELNPRKIFYDAIENCKPVLKLMQIVKGGVAYQVPVPCREKEQLLQSIKFIITSCKDRERNKIPMCDKLAYELLGAANHEGRAVRKKQELHRACEANKAYAHYRW